MQNIVFQSFKIVNLKNTKWILNRQRISINLVVTYRPCKIEWKSNRIIEAQRLCTLRRHIHTVLSQKWRPDLAKRTVWVQINFGLVSFQANTKPRMTRSDTVSIIVWFAATTFVDVVLSVFVGEML